MKCHSKNRRLSALLDGEVHPGEARDLNDHLSVCPVCRREWEEWVRADRRVKSLDPIRVSPGFAARVRKGVEYGTEPGRSHDLLADLGHGIAAGITEILETLWPSRRWKFMTMAAFDDSPPYSLGRAYLNLLNGSE